MSAADTVRLVRGDELRLSAGQTPGMTRREAFVEGNAWVGLVTTEPGMASGWHHHAGYDSYIHVLEGHLRMESGAGGSAVVEAGPGDFLHVPREAVQREANAERTEGRLLIVRVGTGPPVVNVDGPATEAGMEGGT